MDSSSYLIGDLGYTLIPNGSALCINKPFTLTITKPEEKSYMGWNAFIRAHRTGITLIPVSENLLQSEADTKVVRDRVSANQELGKTCITTFKNLPVRISNSQASPTS